MYKQLNARLALAANLYGARWGYLHLGRASKPGCPWIQHPSLICAGWNLTDWALPFRISLGISLGSRPGGHLWPDGKSIKTHYVTLRVDVLCLSLAVLVYQRSECI